MLVKPPWYGALDTNGGKHGVLVKPPWYGVLDKRGGVQGRWLSPHGMVCWISKGWYRGVG